MATTFTDNRGRKWDLALTIGGARRIQQATGVNILALNDPPPPGFDHPAVTQPPHARASGGAGGTGGGGGAGEPMLTILATSDWLMVDVIFCLLRPQAEKADVSEDQFAESLGGGELADAKLAFWESVADFSQRLRPDQSKAVAKQLELIEKALTLSCQQIDAIDVDKAAQQVMKPGSRSGNSPESSASTRPG
jgi:hypothetical protein